MQQFRWRNPVIIILLLFSCSKDLPVLRGLDKAEWLSDRNGCLGKRAGMVDAIQVEKEKLLSLNEMQIVALLGKPDENELYKRNQKFYNYYLTASSQCDQNTDTISIRLIIRFNAVGLASEVIVE